MLFSILILFTSFYITDTYPTVLMHGVLANKGNMDELKKMLEMNFKIDVYNIEIGNGAGTSLFTSMNSQLDILCDEIYKIDALKDGFNFIGMSQGGLLARGYVEYCNKYPVINLITLASPNGGVFYKTSLTHDYYEPLQQSTLSITNYWRDPYRYDLYLSNSTYLAALNQEILSNIIQNNLDIVKNFVMIWSKVDEVIMPPESGKFSLQYIDYYNIDISDDNSDIDNYNNVSTIKIIDLFDTDIYKSGRLGLKKLNEENRLKIFETDCTHSQHKEPECFHQLKPIFEQYLL